METSDRSPESMSPPDLASKLPPDLLNRIYNELRELAQRALASGPAVQSLNATALVHDAWIKVAHDAEFQYVGARPFIAYLSQVIRCILVDHVRARRTLRRGADLGRVAFVESAILDSTTIELTALDSALSDLERIHARQAQVIQMRFFGGLTEDEIATQLGIAKRTVSSDVRSAKSWLRARLGREGAR